MALNKNIKDLRVLQIVPQIKPGGVERGVLEIFRFLSQNKIKSFIFCESIDLGLLKKSEENCIFTTGGIKFKDIKKYFYLNLKLKKIINDYRINLIHITSRAPAIIFYNLINQNPKIRYITSLHNPYQGSYFKKYYNSFLLKGDAVIANSNYTKKFIEQNYKLINNIISIPRGVDLEYFNPNKFNNKKKLF